MLDARLVGPAPHVGEEAKRGEMEHVLKLGRQHRVAVDAWVEVHEVVAVADCPAIEKLRALLSKPITRVSEEIREGVVKMKSKVK